MNVVCVKHGSLYGPEWVYKLRAMVSRYLDADYRFVCLTDRQIPDVCCIPLPPGLSGWWSKLGMFEGYLTGHNLYFDLDIVISADITPLLECFSDPSKLWALDDFSYSLRSPRQGLSPDFNRYLGGKGGTINSSVMLWHGDFRELLEDFTESAKAEVHGDQNWITQRLWPERIGLIPDGMACSYKYHICRGKPRAPITVFHGDPKPDSVTDEFVREFWRA